MKCSILAPVGCLFLTWALAAPSSQSSARIGQEVVIVKHLQDNEAFTLSIAELIEFGRKLFEANWTEQDGGGRPLSKGTGKPVSDPLRSLRGPRGFNRISGPDANSCQGCHNAPYGITGGDGDFVTNAFELAERFDFVTFDRTDARVTGGTLDERKQSVSLQTVGNLRSTPGLFGAGYLELLARQMTEDLQRIRDSITPGQSTVLVSKGISFGALSRHADGRWDVGGVEGLPESSSASTRGSKPSLVVRPWQQGGHAVSLREVTNDAYNRHLGIQTTERFGVNSDPDGDGVKNEMSRADVTAVTVFQATLAVPGRVISNDPEIERAVLTGERTFEQIGCSTCHVSSLPLGQNGWTYSEPNPFNPAGNLRRSGSRIVRVDLNDTALPSPRLAPSHEDPTVTRVPAYTDFKLHDIGDGGGIGVDALDLNQPVSSQKFTAGNRTFLTRRLWGVGNQLTHFHHGLFTTIRQAVLAHGGEALERRRAFEHLTKGEQDGLIEFLKSLQVLPPGTKALVVDERYQSKAWPATRTK